MNNEKVIFTIDFDAFFASLEEAENPELKKYPLVIGKYIGDKYNRGIISTANYKARELGIHSAMPIYKIKNLIDAGHKINIVEPRHDYYSMISEKLFSVIKTFSSKIQVASIDECYLDVTDTLFETKQSPIELAKQIQRTIFNQYRLTVSIGISQDILLSKMASSLRKPNAISTIYKEEIQEKLWPLDIGKLYGCGKKTTEFLILNGVNKIGDLAKLKFDSQSKMILEDKIGKKLDSLINLANGISTNKIETEYYEVKSISHGETYINPLLIHEIDLEIRKLLEVVIKKMKYRNLAAKSCYLNIKLKNEKGSKFKPSFSKSGSLNNYTNDLGEIFFNLIKLLDGKDLKNIIHITVGVSKLKNNYFSLKQNKIQNLDKKENKKESSEIKDIIFRVNSKFNQMIVTDLKELNENKRFKNTKITHSDNIKFKTWDEID